MEQQPRAGTKAALQNILEAIRTLKRLEKSGESASPADQVALAKFTGCGAVARTAFPDPVTGAYAPGWEPLGTELRRLLTDDEYASAKATTFTAFYTSKLVMDAMFRGLLRMGITAGARGLEPGCGIGNFLHAAPEDFAFIGVEQDSVSGRIAAQLHPEHEIRIEDFARTSLPEGSVDFVIGNVPFAEITLPYQGRRHALHDFFFLRSLDALRPGGALALVTSRYTLDKTNDDVRELLAERADFVGAIRLPGDAFLDQGTKVVTDIIFLRKKLRSTAQERDIEGAQPARRLSAIQDPWLHATKTQLPGGEVTLNRYFQEHPGQVLGQMSVGHGMYNAQDLRIRAEADFATALRVAIDALPRDICPPRQAPLVPLPLHAIDPSLPSGVEEGAFFLAPDKTILQRIGGRAEPALQSGKPLSAGGSLAGRRLAMLITLKEQARAVLRTQQDGLPDAEREAARARLRETYSTIFCTP